MNENDAEVVALARGLSADLAEYATAANASGEPGPSLPPEDDRLAQFDDRVLDVDLRAATRTRFVAEHYADAVEAGVKALCECIRGRTGRSEDGDALMTVVFSPNAPLLRINRGKSKSDESEQRGHMFLCQGIIGAWRNPRAHTLIDDSPERALMMLSTIDELIRVTKAATRTRKKRP
ncbi:TIGR02391 family protein [Microbacterium sp. 20-116]|uniref:TIGR02391 family protein n=1 Tax=Microbacterium sp. 20-116 TaxID=3239883 RepID=UPI0034E2736D